MGGSLSLLQENVPNPGTKPQVSQVAGGTAGTLQAYLSMIVSLLIKRTSLHEKKADKNALEVAFLNFLIYSCIRHWKNRTERLL